jgi:hypothetical protein
MEGAHYDAQGRILAGPGTFMFNAPGARHGGISCDLTLYIHCAAASDRATRTPMRLRSASSAFGLTVRSRLLAPFFRKARLADMELSEPGTRGDQQIAQA